MIAHRKNSITPDQLRALWTIAGGLGVAEDTLRDLVESISGQRSTRGLSLEQASRVIDRLSGKQQGGGGKARHRELDNRPNMATGAQLRKIEAMWAERSRAEDKSGSLRRFVQHKFSVSDLRFLGRTRASDVIVALEKMEVL